MARPLRIEFAGAIYHITARGNARQDIYLTDDDRSAFLALLVQTCGRYDWRCHAYCLMSNHYHLLLETHQPTLSKGMQFLNGLYTQHFNRQHHRTGHLYQGRFKGILVERDAYLLELARYIVLNPVRASMVRSAKDWPWSSYRATAGLAPIHNCLITDWILGSFGRNKKSAQKEYRTFIADGKKQPSPWPELKNQIYLGSVQFVEAMQGKIQPGQSLDDIPKRQKHLPPKPLDYYSGKYSSRDKALAEAYRSGQYTLAEVGKHFGVSYVTVSRAVKKQCV